MSGGEQSCPKADICDEINLPLMLEENRTSVARMVIVITYEFFEPSGCCSSVAGPIRSD